MNTADTLKKFDLFDSHLHIIDKQYPLIANNGYLPDEFTCQAYRAAMAPYHLIGGAVVSGSFQAFDQTYLIAALNELGPSFVGVTQVPSDISDDDILALDKAGVRAVRFNIKRGGSLDLAHLHNLAARIYELALWHVELYIDSRELTNIFAALIQLPAVSIDHLGLSAQGLPSLLRLAEQGVRVKATGFSRVDFAVAPALKDFFNANPHALMFGTDMPSTRAPRAYAMEDFILVADTLGEAAAQKVFSLNARTFYKLKTTEAISAKN